MFEGHVCPWWWAYTFDNPLRRLVHPPEKILGPYLKPGMTALDAGAGLGYFAIAMAALVAPGGRVIAVDLQDQALKILRRRARRRGVEGLIMTRKADPADLKVREPVDFALSFYVAHETRDQAAYFRQIALALRAGCQLLLAEPSMHTPEPLFQREVELAEEAGLTVVDHPPIHLARACLFRAGK